MSFFLGLFIGMIFCGLAAYAFHLRQRDNAEIEEWTDKLYHRADIVDSPRVATRIVNRERTIVL